MLRVAAVFLVLALIAALFGFGSVSRLLMGRVRGSSSSSLPSSPCCPSWGPRTEGGLS